LGEFLDDESVRPRKELLGPWLAERGLVLLYAPTGIGKSWFAAGVAAAVAGGGTFGGYRAEEAGRVLYIDGEMDPSDLKERLAMIASASEGTDPGKVACNIALFARHHQPPAAPPFPNLGDPGDREKFMMLIRHLRPALVVLDNLSTLASVAEENAAETWDPVLDTLQEMRRAGSAVLVVHHSNKSGGSYRGSSKIGVLFDSIMHLRPDPETPAATGASFIWGFEKARRLGVDVHRAVAGRLENGVWAWDTRIDANLMLIVQLVKSGQFRTQTELAQHLGVSAPALSKDLTRLDKAGVLTREERKKHFDAAKEEETLMKETTHSDF
jgi:biotin operon repressor